MSWRKKLMALAMFALPGGHPTQEREWPQRRDVEIMLPLPNWKRSGVAAAKRAAKRRRKAKR
ncbi:hypothetical protein A7Q01_02150 [Eikenella sp. NML96-A-049]|uniref:hypothetical protein n=1 Tax=Eikenella sp. NML96-A-049 TaxID=1809061 RepID=UPI0007E18D5F|nr:hypothetical protein [Eikenella sp. NML96-A-049]OAM41759.1 hypothetical protein A7Q01_02150 [Eikenella sp. NML96-A-049]